jgi:putative two-component system response regulator
MAKAMGWPAEEAHRIRLAGPMHDIGKVGIPDAILRKPGPLTTEEWGVMRGHTVYGYDILKDGSSPLLAMAAELALDHHERWDGAGYPNRKSGEGISTVGRMVAVADVFDALSSQRHYKEAWSFERTARQIEAGRGSQFDPAMADTFLANIDKMIDIKRRFGDESLPAGSITRPASPL